MDSSLATTYSLINFDNMAGKQTLIKEEEIVEEAFRDRPSHVSAGEKHMANNQAMWLSYLAVVPDLKRKR